MDKPKNFKDFAKGDTKKGDVDRSGHLAWKGGDVVIKKADPRMKHLGWGEGDVQFLGNKTLKEDVSYPHKSLSGVTLEHEPVSPDFEHSGDELAHQSTHRLGFDPLQKKAHKDYKLDSQYNFNMDLRKGFNPETGKIGIRSEGAADTRFVDTHVPAMDHVTSLPTKHPMTLYRGFGPGFPVENLRPGEEFQDHGYTGLTSRKAYAHGHGQTSMNAGPGFARVVAKVNVPAGTKGHLLDHPDHVSPLQKEGEFTLQRGTKFKVTKHTHHTDEEGNKYHFVHLDITGQDKADVHEVRG